MVFLGLSRSIHHTFFKLQSGNAHKASPKPFSRRLKVVASSKGPGNVGPKESKGQGRKLAWGGAMYATLLPWVHSVFTACQAAEITEVEQGKDVLGSVLLGDLIMLGLAPLFIYAALKTMGSSEEETKETKSTPGPIDPLCTANVRSVVQGTHELKSTYVSKLADPELRELAESVARNIEAAVRDAQETCTFQSSLHSLAVTHGGAEADNTWIDTVLEKSVEEVKNDTNLAVQLADEAGADNGKVCRTVARTIAERTAIHELKELLHKLQENRGGLK